MSSSPVINARAVDIERRDGMTDWVGEVRGRDSDGGSTPTMPVEHRTNLDNTPLAGRPSWVRTNMLDEGWRKTPEKRDGTEPKEYNRQSTVLLRWFPVKTSPASARTLTSVGGTSRGTASE